MNSIETEAATVDEAVREALRQLGATEDQVTIEVLSTPRAGLLGLGARPARVKVTRKPVAAKPAPGAAVTPKAAASASRPEHRQPASHAVQSGDDSETHDDADEGPERTTLSIEQQASEALQLLKLLLEMMGEKAEPVLTLQDPESIEFDLKGDGSGILIGRHGQTLDALEYLVNRLIARKVKDAVPIALDTESYRVRRRQQLERMALSMGERAKREHKAVLLDPMPPRDRRIIHLTLKDDPLITTRSSGGGYLRSLQIAPVDGGRRERTQRPSRDNRPPRESNEPRDNRESRNEPLGQQGGFKRGQKRIV